jgi:GGDEF domain-containing protein
MVYVKTEKTAGTKNKIKIKESKAAGESAPHKADRKEAFVSDAQSLVSQDDDIFNVDVSKPAPKGLYSQRSGLGWEEYIKDRLDSEIHRCSAAENDLVLILMNFRGVSDDETFKKAADETVNFFSSRDLVFEYGQSGAAVIIPGTDLEAGISKSEKFYQRVKEKLPEDSAFNLRIGMSSRAGRLINADRLLLETREALKRASGDPNTAIIAFKSDPDKYREYIKNHG